MPPAPKPTHLKIVSGAAKNHPGRINPKEPKLKRGWPKPPRELLPEARKYWHEFCQVIDDHRVLTPQHGRPIAEMCELYALILGLRDDVDKNGRVIVEISVKGEEKIKINPALPHLIAAQVRFYQMLGQFGLTPSAVTRVSGLDGGENKDPKDSFFED